MSRTEQHNRHCPLEVDARGLRCPMPLLKAKQALGRVQAGDYVRLVATDPGSVKDIHSFVKLTSHFLADYSDEGDCFVYLLQKGDPQPHA